MKWVLPSPDGTWPDSIGRNLTGLLVRLGAIIRDKIRAGPVATIANPNISKIGLKLPATSPTKVANKPTGEYKKLSTFCDRFFKMGLFFVEFLKILQISI